MADGAAEADLHLVTQHQLDDILGVAGAHRDLDARMGVDEALQELGEDVGADRWSRGDHEVAGRGRHHLLQRVAAVDQGSEGALREGDPGAARVGQAHAVGGAQEEGGAQLAFEALEAGGQGGLGDEEGLRGPAHAAPAGHLEEALDLDELDATWLPVTGFFYGHGG